MAEPTPGNDPITDAVTQANVKVLGEAPAQALATVYQTLAQATSLVMQNAVAAQQQMQAISTAATVQAVNAIMAMNQTAVSQTAQATQMGETLTQLLAELKILTELLRQQKSV